jgi:hypothetical protein
MTPATLVGLMVALGPAPASAPPSVDKLSCVTAHEAAQELRQRNLLAESRERLLLCSDPRCPPLVSEECQALLVDIDRQSAAGDAARLSPPLSPPAPSPPERREANNLAPDAVTPPSPASLPLVMAIDPDATPVRRPRPTGPSRAALVPGALAVVALANAAFFGWRGLSQAEELRRTCSPDCEPSRVSPVRRQLLIADVSLLAGVGLGAVTAWMIWSARSSETGAAPLASSASRRQPGAGWSLVPALGSLRVEYGGRF